MNSILVESLFVERDQAPFTPSSYNHATKDPWIVPSHVEDDYFGTRMHLTTIKLTYQAIQMASVEKKYS